MPRLPEQHAQQHFEAAGRGAFTTVPHEVVDHALIRHEESHWLQSIGTTSGLFAQLIRMAQSNLALLLFSERLVAPSPEIFPLHNVEEHSEGHPYVLQWRQLETILRMFLGGISREGLIEIMASASPGPKAFKNIDNYIQVLLGRELDGNPFDRLVEARHQTMDVSAIRAVVDDNSDDLLGAEHLMEAGGAWAEYDVLNRWTTAYFAGTAAKRVRFNVDHTAAFFTGDYGAARRLLYLTIQKEPTQKGEVLCRLLIDVALNSIAPPLILAADLAQDWMSIAPVPRFISLAKQLSDVNIEGDFDYADLAATREFCAQIYERLAARGVVLPGQLATLVRSLFAGYENVRIPDDLYGFGEDGKVYSDPASTHRFFGHRVFHAFALRELMPEFFPFPTVMEGVSQTHYHNIFKSVEPPLYWREGEIVISPVDPSAAGLVHFLKRAAVADIVRWQMYLSWPELVTRLVDRYVRSAPEVRVGMECVYSASTGVWRDGQLAGQLMTDVATALRRDGIDTRTPA